MSTETLLRLSLIQAELRRLAAGLDAPSAKVVIQSAALLNLLGSKPDDLGRPSDKKRLRLV